MTDTTNPGALLQISEDQIIKELAIPPDTLAKFDKVMLEGDYSALTAPERSLFIRMQCKRAGLAADLNPIMFIPTNGKLVPYMKKGAAEQLRAMHQLNAEVTEKWVEGNFVHVQVRVSGVDGRFEDDFGSAPLAGTDAYKKAVTQAKRRATLGFCGMGALDPKDEVEENGHSNGPARIAPPPVDPGSRYQGGNGSVVSTTKPEVSMPQALPDPKKGGASPPVVVAIPKVRKPE